MRLWHGPPVLPDGGRLAPAFAFTRVRGIGGVVRMNAHAFARVAGSFTRYTGRVPWESARDRACS